MSKMYVSVVDTEGCDRYVFLHKSMPFREDIVKQIAEWEGCEVDIEFYNETISIDIIPFDESEIWE